MSPKANGISVLMPVYNGAKYLVPAIESILNQTLTDFELLICDDGSTDETRNLVAGFDDPRIRLLVNESNRGIVHTRNRLFREASGNFLAIMDSDDISLPGRLRKQTEFFGAHPDYTLCGTNTTVIDSKGETIKHWARCINDPEIKARFLFGNQLVTSSVMINRAASPVDLRFDEDFPVAEDFHLWARIAMANGKVHNLPEVLTHYRGHEEGISKTQKDLILERIYQVSLFQLRVLTGGFSPAEERIHHALYHQEIPEGLAGFAPVLAWMDRLIASNREQGWMEEPYLSTVLWERAYGLLAGLSPLPDAVRILLGTRSLPVAGKWYYLKSLLRDKLKSARKNA